MLKCSMYDNALVPVALANRLVSLADMPSSEILSKFARDRLRTQAGRFADVFHNRPRGREGRRARIPAGISRLLKQFVEPLTNPTQLNES
jgi:hypothetical protein